MQAQGVQKPNTASYDDGITLFENGLFKKSAEELAKFIKHHPQSKLVESAAFYRARAEAQSDPVHARGYYRQFLTDYPNTVFAQKIMISLAKKESQAGNYDKAISLYQQALHQSITNNQAARIYYWMAETEVKRKNYDKARSYYLTLANNYPKTDWAPKALYSRGRIYLREDKFKAASQAFSLLQKRYPNDKMTRRIGTALGESYYKQQKYNHAISALKKNLPYLKGDQRQKAILLIAESYNALNKYKKASSRYLQYINLTKGTDKERLAHYGLGWLYHKQKIYHWAAREFGKAAQGQDTLARKALYLKAINEKMGGYYKKSIKSFKEFGKRYKGGLWYEHVYYEWAITSYQMGNYGDAIETLLKLVRSGKKLKMKGKIYTLLGRAYFADKEYTRALRAYNAAENMTNVKPAVKRKARYQKAWLQYRNQAYQPAQKIFADLYRQAPNTKIGNESLFWDANSYYHMHQYSTAAQLFREFLQKNPNNKLTGAARYSLGWSYFKMGQYGKAIQPFKAFLNNYNPPKIALFPYDTDTRLRLGDSYYALSDYNKAIQIYQKSVGDDPGGDYALFQIANCYYRSNRIYQAVKTFRQFLKKFPNSSLREQAQYNIAYVYLNSGNYQQAVKEFKTAIRKYPGTQWAARSQYNIGDAYYNAGEYQKAIDAYQKVMNNYPNSHYLVEAANGIQYARQAAKSGNPKKRPTGQAVDTTSILKNFIKHNPHNTRAADRLRYRQAESLVQSGDYLKAIKKLKQYIRVSNNEQLLPEAYINLAVSYKQTSHQSDAINAYQTVVKQYSHSDEAAKALAALGQMMYSQRQYQKSYQYYKQLANKGSENRLKAYVGMGNAQLAMNKTAKAKSNYQSALNINSGYDAATVGLARIDITKKNYTDAEQKLRPVAQKNTKEPGAEAQYLLGVIQQQQKNYSQALQAYSKVRTLYKAYDHWVAQAMLKSGQCYYHQGNKTQGRRVLQSLMKNYPQSTEAMQARQLIKRNKQ
ncbi:MAG TPA: tetratricopeptide repeat protein [Balneolaceae bacterium]|nr:tetratricopeptide repeat protein [Balneolaceae bacterium]